MGERALGGSRSSSARPQRSPWRRVRHRLGPLLSRPLFWLGLHTLPWLYLGYMRLVWATSRVELNGLMRGHEIAAMYDGFVALTLHEDHGSIHGERPEGFDAAAGPADPHLIYTGGVAEAEVDRRVDATHVARRVVHLADQLPVADPNPD